MKYTCKDCGWIKEDDYGTHTSMEEIFAHERKHKEKN